MGGASYERPSVARPVGVRGTRQATGRRALKGRRNAREDESAAARSGRTVAQHDREDGPKRSISPVSGNPMGRDLRHIEHSRDVNPRRAALIGRKSGGRTLDGSRTSAGARLHAGRLSSSAGSDLSTTMYTPEGLEIAFAGGGAATELITIQEENADGTVSAGDRFTMLATVDAADETTIGALTALDASLSAEYEDGDNTDKFVVMSDYGTKITLDKSDSRESADIVYPSEQAYADVFVNGVDTQITEGTEGGATYGDVQRIEVGAAVLDTEVANIAAQNVIVVGGPCVNTLAAELMGNPADCTTGFEDGKAMIKLFDQSGGKVAMLVAGYSAMDTRRASRVVANYDDYSNFDGTELEVTGTSLSDITVSAPQ